MSAPRNAEYTKLYNQKTFLRLLRREPLSRADIARRMGLTRAASSLIAEELLRTGLVVERPDFAVKSTGRPPITLAIAPDALFALGVYLNRDGCSAGIVSLSGEVSSRARFRLSPERKIEALCESLDRLLKASGIPKERLLGIGISAPGPLDASRGEILNPPHFTLWHNTAIAREVEKRMGLPVLVENNASSLAAYHLDKEETKGSENFMLLLVDSGIGSGLVLGGKLFFGGNGHTGELGHTSIRMDGIPCPCGRRGCLEAYAAIPNLLAGTRFSSWEEVMNERLISPDAEEIFRKEIDYLACGVVNAANLLGIDTVLLAGDLRYEGEITSYSLSEEVGRRLLRREGKPFTVRPAHADENTKPKAAAEAVFSKYLRTYTKESL